MDIDGFLERDYDRVVRSVALACGDHPLAREAVDEAVTRAIDRHSHGRPIDNLPGWITVVAIHWANRWFRRRRVEAGALAQLAPLQRASIDGPDGTHIDVARAVARLPLRQRESVVLHYLHDISIDQIAELLGVSQGTVKSALSRARHTLAAALSDDARLPRREPHAP